MAGGGRLHIASHATRDSALTRQTTPRNMHVDHRCDDGPSAEYVGSSHRSPSSRVKGHRGAVVPGTGKCGGILACGTAVDPIGTGSIVIHFCGIYTMTYVLQFGPGQMIP
jgi:hypothetical protein